jgi:hypothetical protein
MGQNDYVERQDFKRGCLNSPLENPIFELYVGALGWPARS